MSRRSVTPRDLSNTGSPAGFPKTRAKKRRGMLRIKSAMLSLCLCECGPHSPIATPLIEMSISHITEMDTIYIYIYLQIIKQLYKYSFSISIYWCPSSFFLPLNLLPRYLTQFSFYVMESRVSRKCTRNIHRPSTPGKEVN